MEYLENEEKIVILKDGKEVECDVLFTFDSEDTGKTYFGYTDHSIDKNGRKRIYVWGYNLISGNGKLEDITDPKELDMVQEVLAQIDEESRNS